MAGVEHTIPNTKQQLFLARGDSDSSIGRLGALASPAEGPVAVAVAVAVERPVGRPMAVRRSEGGALHLHETRAVPNWALASARCAARASWASPRPS
jgi:hypothetical protein